MTESNQFVPGTRVRIIEKGSSLFGKTGTIVLDPEAVEDSHAEWVDVKLDETGEIIQCYDPWGQTHLYLEILK